MTSFKFPPPPPPPSKPASRDAQPSHDNSRGIYDRGSGVRGRGREGGAHRGSGFHSSSGGSRGGHGQSNGRGNARGRGGPRGGHQNGRGGSNNRQGSSAGHSSHQSPPPNTPPVKAYVNPSFVNQSQAQSSGQPQVDPNAFAQVMSFMSTPAGVQSMAAFASHMTGTGNAGAQNSQTSPPPHTQRVPQYSPPPHAGQKRKLNDRTNRAQPQTQQPGTKPPRAKAAVPPPVPSFGFSLPAVSTVRPSAPLANGKNDQKKRKLNLGLTQDNLQDESSEEEDIDEEAAYAQKLKGGGFVFEHEGEQIAIQTGAEVAAWIKDRRKNFPTQKRIIERAQEAAAKRQSELEFLRRIHGKPPKAQDDGRRNKPPTAHNGPKHDPRKREDDIRKQDELAALRKKLHESMLKKQAAPTAVDLGLGYDSETESDRESSVLSESSVVSSSEESSEESEYEAESDANDVAPEATSSKVGPAPIKVPPPAPVQSQSRNDKDKICSNWQRNGHCKFSNKCRYAHPPKAPKEEHHMSLYDRLVEQELVKTDQLVLAAIKSLGQNGFLG